MKSGESKDFIFSVVLLAGTIIGAGVFSLPYIFSRLGVINGIFYLIAFTLIYFVLHWMYGRLLEINKGNYQFFYLTKKYLPSFISLPAALAILGELILTLTIYLILAPVFGQLIFGSSGWIFLLIFWLLGSLFIFAKLSWLGMAEFFGLGSTFLILGLIIFLGLNRPFQVPLWKNFNWSTFFLPFGPLLFSLTGRPAISKVVEFYHRFQDKKKKIPLAKIIFWGTALPAFVYLIFVLGILRLNPQISPEAFNSLGFLSPLVLTLLGLIGLIGIWTSYFILGINLRETLISDLRFSRLFSALLVLFLPPLLYLIGLRNFLAIISLAGNVFLALEAIFIITMWRRAFPQDGRAWLIWPLYFIFALAFIYGVVTFVG
ncbi:hypothetical protein COY65_02070 [Candidatus Jorgensenbacteria bacterium CG_4_10_14_0_8_um_filter_39_13]|uniref:Amino acid transporter transmembrane domain-containing protein n=2 Tax=Candidatus Joergenseniibacteriota TaxID=1752739 RepID=A0A2M7RGF8_9BACT|nr:MAG: hypothetical protein COV54_02975 [Candidatus Jorgensenbacteria bacterium CG11_big_fil_rev_8_21_14_0_20_38_23]PIV13018.1 MAG: hypothetical protein COS46_02320 [Candidatus Jorgensenbacteria bacterium CG03_land_8_20_14_0_80_38_39]PIW97536.1 MAG: hypothetical protein COZ81_02170 [Candidatus Jorgensenbacteria bacterium CG_4_8_14_3_um_filter_38_10]PIY95845.1 MAG: hypothetical protein COY65_02070 [Candidatus Jorgensenbacteria bacterium CG_4_10_14_0_8_um_filter_39_13]PJA95040.1 MAG: hypothetica